MIRVAVVENWEGRGRDIARLVRGPGRCVESFRPYLDERLPEATAIDLAVLSGGPMGVGDAGRPGCEFLTRVMQFAERVLGAGTPILGICLGHQILARVLGGQVQAMARPDRGIRVIYPAGLAKGSKQLAGVPFPAFVYHHDEVTKLPPGCELTFQPRRIVGTRGAVPPGDPEAARSCHPWAMGSGAARGISDSR
jgi:GMP synthase-like glutamine amidotransferase